MRSSLLLLGAGVLGFGGMVVVARDARACGGCFHEQPATPTQNPDVITDHRMIFRISPQETTLYDQVRFQGSPQSFAWVLPIHGPVTVGLSSDRVFAVLDSVTATVIKAPSLPPCPSSSCSCPGEYGGEADASAHFSADSGSAVDAGVTVLSQQVVGPYETVQLQSTNPTALTDWLTANGYSIPSDVAPIVTAYVNEGFDFLAMKLQPGQGVQAMRPVRITAPGAALTLPLRMVAAGTGATVGITLWVIGDGEYEPQNFPSFFIQPSELTWDWSASSSDYTTLRAHKEAMLGNAAWQIESSLSVSAYSIENPVLADPADQDYEAIPAADAGDAGPGDAGPGEAGTGETADQVRQDDLAKLFPGNEYGTAQITRLRADLSHAALAKDLVLQASAAQGGFSNDYQVTKSVNAPVCPAVQPCNCGPDGASGTGGCATTPTDDGAGAEPIVLGMLGVAFVLANARSRRRR